MYNVDIDTDAFADVQDAVEWYNQQKEGLGEEFFLAFDNEVKRICRNPFAFAVKYAKIRSKLTGKFPYGIYYEIDKEHKTVNVIAVIRGSRNPDIWKERIK